MKSILREGSILWNAIYDEQSNKKKCEDSGNGIKLSVKRSAETKCAMEEIFEMIHAT